MDYYSIPASGLNNGNKIPLKCLGESNGIFRVIAEEMIACITQNNLAGKRTVFIVPVGPVGHYPVFVQLVNERRVSLKNVWFFNMDEYMLDETHLVPKEHRLSFRGFMDRVVYSQIDPELVMPESQRIFPDPEHPEKGDLLLQELGGPDITFGGIGINGHLAFNEADETLSPEEFASLPTRVLKISRETITSNAIGDLGGAIEDMPRYCVTIGMKQILSAKKVRLGVFRDWHRAVVRRVAFGEMSASFPASLLQQHPDACVYVNDVAAQQAY